MIFYRNKPIRFYIFCFIILFSIPCYGFELGVRQLVDGTNLARTTIRSGEFRLLVSIHHGARHSTEEIRRWIEAETVRIRKKQEDYLKHEYEEEIRKRVQEHFDEEVANLQLRAKFMGEWEEAFEANIALEIYDQHFDKAPEYYKYRVVQIDRNDIDPYSKEGEFFHVGAQTILIYDGEKHIEEWESPRIQKTVVTIYSRKKVFGFFHLELHGRSFYRIPVDKARLLKQEKIGSVSCYVVEAGPIEGPPGERYTIRYWIAPQLEFCLVREEVYDASGSLSCLTMYADYRQFSDNLWFPMRSEYTVYRPDGSILKHRKMLIKEAQLNVSFPENYFSIDVENLFDKEVTVDARSESQLFLKPKPRSNQKSKTISLPECGPRSLLAVCQVYGIKASMHEIMELSSFHPEGGTSMLGLYQAAQQKELNPRGVRINLSQLRKQKMPAIVHVNPRHFVMVEKINDQQIDIYDPAGKYDKLPIKEFEKIWDGNVLLFDPKTRQTTGEKLVDAHSGNQPEMFVEEKVHDFGLVDAGTKLEHAFILANRGNAPLEILDIVSACRCTVALPSSKQIPPGEQAKIKITLSILPEQDGSLKESISIYTNDPKHPRLQLKVLATVQQPIVVFPKRVSFGRFKSQSSILKTLDVRIRDANKTEIVGIRSSSDYISTKIIEKQKDYQILGLTTVPDIPPGRFESKLFIDYISGGKKVALEIPVVGEALGEIEVKPARVFFGIVHPQKNPSRKVKLSSLTQASFQILSVKSNSEYISTSIDTAKDGLQHELTISVNPRSPKGDFSSTIEIMTSNPNQPHLSIPVYWIVLAN